MIGSTNSETREAEILIAIKDSEKRADEIIEKAKKESESILQEAAKKASKMIDEEEKESRNAQIRKLAEFTEKSKLIGDEKSIEGKALAKQTKAKSDKNSHKAVEMIIKKFEEMI